MASKERSLAENSRIGYEGHLNLIWTPVILFASCFLFVSSVDETNGRQTELYDQYEQLQRLVVVCQLVGQCYALRCLRDWL